MQSRSSSRSKRTSALVALTAAALLLPACRKSSVAAANGGAHTQAPATHDPAPLPEDPVLGARSTAQWQEHLAAEERERKLHYDRDRMADHRAVVQFLVGTRARYERAASKAAVTAIQARLPPRIDDVRQRIKRIDHWGGSSNLLADYDALLNALASEYPAARVRFLAGDRAPLVQSRADFDKRMKFVERWLEEAAESEDE